MILTLEEYLHELRSKGHTEFYVDGKTITISAVLSWNKLDIAIASTKGLAKDVEKLARLARELEEHRVSVNCHSDFEALRGGVFQLPEPPKHYACSAQDLIPLLSDLKDCKYQKMPLSRLRHELKHTPRKCKNRKTIIDLISQKMNHGRTRKGQHLRTRPKG